MAPYGLARTRLPAPRGSIPPNRARRDVAGLVEAGLRPRAPALRAGDPGRPAGVRSVRRPSPGTRSRRDARRRLRAGWQRPDPPRAQRPVARGDELARDRLDAGDDGARAARRGLRDP